ncbi:potassium channel family protein [Enterococcus faecalis]|uniref:potassium channel family protein n=1 Tax=Enterococcus faecalis TaxID=1351 RepID=UPI0021AA2D83
MLSLLISVKKLFSSFLGILKKEDTRALFFLLATTLLNGTIFYSTVEKLSPLDSLYLSFMTLTTIGYGDVHPVTDLGKIFTMVYATVGLGIMAIGRSKILLVF